MKLSTKNIYSVCDAIHRATYNTAWSKKDDRAKAQSKAAYIKQLEALTPETDAAKKRIKKTLDAIKAR